MIVTTFSYGTLVNRNIFSKGAVSVGALGLLALLSTAYSGASFWNFFAAAGSLPLSASPYPVRTLTLNTLGKTVLLDGTAPERDGRLTETVGDISVRTWKVKYERKGNSRRVCEPPVLNLSFDKTDSKGRRKELFTGISTVPGHTALQYQKIRLIPECDIWPEFLGGGEMGFGGKLNVLLREYMIARIFRAFGVPTADVIGFANISFTTPDAGYESKTFRYLLMQRTDEPDDELPFPVQFNLTPGLIESSDLSILWQIDWERAHRLRPFTLTSWDGTDTPISFDPATTLRFLLLSEFVSLFDMTFLLNEDWGIDRTTGKTHIIPHSFDGSFTCALADPAQLQVTRLIQSLPKEERAAYQKEFYRVARELFGSPATLSRMLGFADSFPYEDVSREELREFLRLQFHRFAQYLTSATFAGRMGERYEPLSPALPFSSEGEYRAHEQEFLKQCHGTARELPSGVSVRLLEPPTITVDSSGVAHAAFTAEIRTGTTPLNILKSAYGGAFTAALLGLSSGNREEVPLEEVSVSGARESVGSHYIIPPNARATFALAGSVDPLNLWKDRYIFSVERFRPNFYAAPTVLDSTSEPVSLGTLDRVEITAPSDGASLLVGRRLSINWSGSPDRPVYLAAESSDGKNRSYLVGEKSETLAHEGGSFLWTVGSAYVATTFGEGLAGYRTDALPPGDYRLFVEDAYSGKRGENNVLVTIAARPGTRPKTATVTVLSPNGGEEFTAGARIAAEVAVETARTDLRFAAALVPFSKAGHRLIDIPLLSACGQLNTLANSDCQNVSVGSGEYATTFFLAIPSSLVPSDAKATDYKVEVYLVEPEETGNRIAARDQSDAVFSIPLSGAFSGGGSDSRGTVPPIIRVTEPRAGSAYTAGAVLPIRWTSAGAGVSDIVKIELARDGETPLLIAAATSNDGSYDWGPLPPEARGEGWSVRISSSGALVGESAGTIAFNAPEPALRILLRSAERDVASVWTWFRPGAGNLNENPNDWHWTLTFENMPAPKIASRITLIHNAPGEVWSTGYARLLRDGTDLYGYEEHPYPLAVFERGESKNTVYDESIEVRPGKSTLDLYGQPEEDAFSGGRVVVEFTDGTKMEGVVPASAIKQKSVPDVSSAKVQGKLQSSGTTNVSTPRIPSASPEANTPVIAAPEKLSISVSVKAGRIESGENTSIRWEARGADGGCRNTWDGTGVPAGVARVEPIQTTTYSITCFGADGKSLTKSVTVEIVPPPVFIPAETPAVTPPPSAAPVETPAATPASFSRGGGGGSAPATTPTPSATSVPAENTQTSASPSPSPSSSPSARAPSHNKGTSLLAAIIEALARLFTR